MHKRAAASSFLFIEVGLEWGKSFSQSFAFAGRSDLKWLWKFNSPVFFLSLFIIIIVVVLLCDYIKNGPRFFSFKLINSVEQIIPLPLKKKKDRTIAGKWAEYGKLKH